MDDNALVTVKIQTTVEKFDELGDYIEIVNLEEEQIMTLGQAKTFMSPSQEEEHAAG